MASFQRLRVCSGVEGAYSVQGDAVLSCVPEEMYRPFRREEKPGLFEEKKSLKRTLNGSKQTMRRFPEETIAATSGENRSCSSDAPALSKRRKGKVSPM